MPLTAILATVAGIGTLTSMLFGGGMLKGYLTHSNELAVQKHIQTETTKKVFENDVEINKLKTSVALIDKDVLSFAAHVKKLEILPEISSKLTGIETLITVMREQIRDFRTERTDHDNKPAK